MEYNVYGDQPLPSIIMPGTELIHQPSIIIPEQPLLALPEAGVDSVSFYTGIGGLDFAAEAEGLRILLANDNWKAAQKNHLNFRSDFLLKDILKTTPEEILERINRKRGELACVFAGSPCPPWSALNRHRSSLNPDLNLTYYYLEMIKGLQPLSFVLEQVPSMNDEITLNAFYEFTCRLEEDLSMYHIQARRIRTLLLGTPQDRTRIIFQGFRKDTGLIPSFPRPIKGSLKHLTIGAVDPEIDYIEIKGKRPIRKEHSEFFSTIPASDHVDLIYKDGRRQPLSERPDLLLKLFGLPEDFRFHPDLSYAQILELIGNSVPVQLGRAVFKEMVRQLRTLR